MGRSAPVTQPQRAAVWLLGSGQGVQVWTISVHPRIRASVWIGDGEAPVILLNAAIVGTPAEGEALACTFAQIAEGTAGFFVCHTASCQRCGPRLG